MAISFRRVGEVETAFVPVAGVIAARTGWALFIPVHSPSGHSDRVKFLLIEHLAELQKNCVVSTFLGWKNSGGKHVLHGTHLWALPHQHRPQDLDLRSLRVHQLPQAC